MLVNERSVRFGWYYRLQRPQSFRSTPTLATSANLLYSSNVIGSYIEKRKDKRKQSTLRKLKKIGSRPEVAILGPEPKKKNNRELCTRMSTCFMQNLQSVKFI